MSRLARERMAAGDYAAAVEIYADIERAMPGDTGVAMNHGIALHLTGRYREALSKLAAARDSGVASAHVSYLIGTAHLALGEPYRAVDALRKAVDADPNMEDAFGALADTLARLGSREEAVRHYLRWTELAPANPTAWFRVGVTCATLAQAALQAVVRQAPESGYMVALAAEVQLGQEQYASAMHLYREALRRQADLPGVHRGLAEIYRRTGHAGWAATEDAREPVIADEACATRTPACLHQRGRWRELAEAARDQSGLERHFWSSRAYDALSRRAFRRLTELPPSAESHAYTARMHQERGRHSASIESWRAALSLRPADFGYRSELAIALQMNGDLAEARPLLEGLTATEPDSVELRYSLGQVLLNLQEPEEAERHLRVVAEQSEDFLPARASLGLALLRLERAGEAIPHLEAALPADTDASTHFRLAQAYRQVGREAEADAMLTRYENLKRQVEERAKFARTLRILPP